MLGNKLTYGQPMQLYHLFSGKYLSIKTHDVSKDHGSSTLYLGETGEECAFIFEPNEGDPDASGLVINFSDYFHIRSCFAPTPFFMHLM
jgi:hypothetical protein